MKISLEINLEFINEDESLEEAFKQQVRESIVNRVSNMVSEKIQPLIDSAVNDNINLKVNTILDDFMSKPITVSSGYKSESYESLISMVETKFTSLYDEKFRNTSGCTKDPILEKVNEKIRYEVNNLTSKMSDTITREGAKLAKKAVEESNLAKIVNGINRKINNETN